MLSALTELTQYSQGSHSSNLEWHHLSASQIHELLPFWDELDIQRISQRLRELGLILIRSAPYGQSQTIEFAFNINLATHANTPTKPEARRHISTSATPIPANWQPDTETLIGLNQLNIPEHFAREQTPEFVRYWRESGEIQRSWGSKFVI